MGNAKNGDRIAVIGTLPSVAVALPKYQNRWSCPSTTETVLDTGRV